MACGIFSFSLPALTFESITHQQNKYHYKKIIISLNMINVAIYTATHTRLINHQTLTCWTSCSLFYKSADFIAKRPANQYDNQCNGNLYNESTSLSTQRHRLLNECIIHQILNYTLNKLGRNFYFGNFFILGFHRQFATIVFDF